MDGKIGWYQPEQQGPAKDLWERVWARHIADEAPQALSSGTGNPIGNWLNTRESTPNLARVFGIGSSIGPQVKLAPNDGCPWMKPEKAYREGIIG